MAFSLTYGIGGDAERRRMRLDESVAGGDEIILRVVDADAARIQLAGRPPPRLGHRLVAAGASSGCAAATRTFSRTSSSLPRPTAWNQRKKKK